MYIERTIRRGTDREIDRERLRGRYVCRDIVGRLRDIVG